MKMPATWLKMYFFTSIFQRFHWLSNSLLLLFKKTNSLNTMLVKFNLMLVKFIHLESFLFLSIYYFISPQSKKKHERKYKIISFMFRNKFSIKGLWERTAHPRCFKMRSVSLQNLMLRKCYFQT